MQAPRSQIIQNALQANDLHLAWEVFLKNTTDIPPLEEQVFQQLMLKTQFPRGMLRIAELCQINWRTPTAAKPSLLHTLANQVYDVFHHNQWTIPHCNVVFSVSGFIDTGLSAKV